MAAPWKNPYCLQTGTLHADFCAAHLFCGKCGEKNPAPPNPTDNDDLIVVGESAVTTSTPSQITNTESQSSATEHQVRLPDDELSVVLSTVCQ